MPEDAADPEPQGFHVRDKGALPIFLSLVAVCGLPFLIGYAVLTCGTGAVSGVADARESALCRERLAKIARGLGAYSADNDGRYPPAEVWMDASWPYVAKKSPSDQFESPFRCPAVSKLRTTQFGYALQEGAGGAPYAEWQDSKTKVLVFDAENSARNAVEGLDALPVPPRHEKGTKNYGALPDGTVRSLDRP